MLLQNIINTLHKYKLVYQREGFNIVGLFGSFAKATENDFSDIDLAYSLEYNKFNKKYSDGFSKLIRIEAIKKELENEFHKKVDLVSLNSANKAFLENIKKDLIYV